jgi:hypothetical protein
MTVKEVLNYIENAPVNFVARSSKEPKSILSAAKTRAVRSNNQELAKQLWCYEQALSVQDQYITSFFMIKNHEFYKAWCGLEQVEIGAQSLKRHYSDKDGRFHISLIQKLTLQWQSLYP